MAGRFAVRSPETPDGIRYQIHDLVRETVVFETHQRALAYEELARLNFRRRRCVVLGVLDAPLSSDWLFWVWLIVSGLTALTTYLRWNTYSTRPPFDENGFYVDAGIGLALVFVFLCLIPGGIRRVWRQGKRQCAHGHFTPEVAFCPECGQPTTRACSRGHAIPYPAVYCPVCGARRMEELNGAKAITDPT